VGNPAYRSSSTAGADSGDYTINKPAGTADGDLLLIFQANYSATATAPTGFSGIGVSGLYDTGNGNLYCWWKIASSEPASWTLHGGASRSDACAVSVQNGTAIDDKEATSTSGTTTAHAGPATASQAGDLVVCAFACGNSSAAFVPDGGLTSLGTIGGAMSNSLDVAYKTQSGSGSSGTFNATFSGGAADNTGIIVLVKGSVTGIAGRRPGMIGSGRKWGKFEHHEERGTIEICPHSIFPFPPGKLASAVAPPRRCSRRRRPAISAFA
jgi:hypothetical protein